MLKKNVFATNGFEYPHIGYTEGYRWNGWATPYFELAEAFVIMEEFNSCDPEFPMIYNKETDTFSVEEMGGFDGDSWKGNDCQTEEGIKHLYGIGAYSWMWDDVTDYDIHNVAQNVEDFLYDYDTYEYWDNHDNRELVLEEIKKQLKDHNTLKNVLTYFYTSDLRGDKLYEALAKELKI